MSLPEKKYITRILVTIILVILSFGVVTGNAVKDWVRFETKIEGFIFYDYIKIGPVTSTGIVLAKTNYGDWMHGFWKESESEGRLYFIGRGRVAIYRDTWIFSTKSGWCRHQGNYFLNGKLRDCYHEALFTFVSAPPSTVIPDLVQQRRKKALRK